MRFQACALILSIASFTVTLTACVHGSRTALPVTQAATVGDDPAARRLSSPEYPETHNSGKLACDDPKLEQKSAFDLPQLSATEIAGLFNRPSNIKELLVNLKILMDSDLMIQPAFFEDQVLLGLSGGSTITWEEPDPHSHNPPQMTIAHVGGMGGGLSGASVRVVRLHTCRDGRKLQFSPFTYVPPTTHDSGFMQVDVHSVAGIDVAAVKEIFGADPDEARSWAIYDTGASVSGPATLRYEDRARESESTPFFKRLIEFVPSEEGGLRPRVRNGDRRLFADGAQILAIKIEMEERD
jgi:hypothetical protein